MSLSDKQVWVFSMWIYTVRTHKREGKGRANGQAGEHQLFCCVVKNSVSSDGQQFVLSKGSNISSFTSSFLPLLLCLTASGKSSVIKILDPFRFLVLLNTIFTIIGLGVPEGEGSLPALCGFSISILKWSRLNFPDGNFLTFSSNSANFPIHSFPDVVKINIISSWLALKVGILVCIRDVACLNFFYFSFISWVSFDKFSALSCLKTILCKNIIL